ncbi:hypothetical protein D3C87_1305520 [compost metagenome]
MPGTVTANIYRFDLQVYSCTHWIGGLNFHFLPLKIVYPSCFNGYIFGNEIPVVFKQVNDPVDALLESIKIAGIPRVHLQKIGFIVFVDHNIFQVRHLT